MAFSGEVPSSLLHYRVLSKLGEGGMGAVYRAEDTKLGRAVAVKLVAGGSGDADADRERLLREARAASALSHPCIVTIFAVEHVAGLDFIVMELVEGTPLDALLAGGPLELARVLALGADVADALDCAHAAGIVHRDIKPANIVVTPRGRAKVLDFGVAKATSPAEAGALDATKLAPLTATGTIVGTVPYMSPEQIRGDALDGRSDVFALGCVLYEAATARRAFGAHEAVAIVHAIMSLDPPAPSSIVATLPAAFDAILRRALAKDRARRFETAAELAAALRALSTGALVLPAELSRRPSTEAILVGRETEAARLMSCFDRAASGEGSLVFVTGDAGIGKSAVLEGFVRRVGTLERPPLVARGTCVEQFGAGEAYLPLLGMLEGLLASREGPLVRETLRTTAPTWALQLRGAHDSGDEALRREAVGATKDAMVRELGDCISVLAARVPLLLLVEDAHWADPSTVSALIHLAHRVRQHRALVVVTARAKEIEQQGHPLRAPLFEWRAKRTVDEVLLSELSQADLASWLDTRFPANDFAVPLAAAIHARTGGHPLYVASLVDYIVEQGRVRKEGGAWRSEPMTASSIGVPESLLGMLRAKIEILPDADRQLLALASVQGEEFSAVVLADAAEDDEVAVDEHLARIARVHRLTRPIAEADLPDGTLDTRWRFAHALYREVAYEDLPSRRRALLHRKVGESLLRHHCGNAERIAGTLAMHFERARDFERAVAYHAQAGESALKVFASVEADAHFTAALGCTDRLPEAERNGARASLLRLRGLTRNTVGRNEESVQDLHAALTAARAVGDAQVEGKTLLTLTSCLIYSHRVREALPVVREAIAIGERIGDEAVRIEGLILLANAQVVLGEVDAAFATLEPLAGDLPLAVFTQAILRYWRSDYATVETMLRSIRVVFLDAGFSLFREMFLGIAVGNLGRLGEARRILEAALCLAKKCGHAAFESRLENCIGWVLREMGDVTGAMEHDARSERLARAIQETEAEANAVLNLTEDAMTTQSAAGFLEHFTRVETLARGDDWMSWRYLIRLKAARARERVTHGTLEEAHAAIDDLFSAATRYQAGKYVTIAKELAALLALSAGEIAEAARAIADARTRLADNPAPLLAWRIEALAARIADRAGNAEAAAAARAAALAIVHDLASDLSLEDRATFLASPSVRAIRNEAMTA